MYCKKCGNEISDGAKFCKFCGAVQETQAAGSSKSRRMLIRKRG